MKNLKNIADVHAVLARLVSWNITVKDVKTAPRYSPASFVVENENADIENIGYIEIIPIFYLLTLEEQVEILIHEIAHNMQVYECTSCGVEYTPR